jgi:hypothetical protein
MGEGRGEGKETAEGYVIPLATLADIDYQSTSKWRKRKKKSGETGDAEGMEAADSTVRSSNNVDVHTHEHHH